MSKMPDNYDLNQPFDGLSFTQWLKVCFLTRAAITRQHDRVMRDMFESMQRERSHEVENDAAYTMLISIRARLGEAERRVKGLSAYAAAAGDALDIVYPLLKDAYFAGNDAVAPALNAVIGAQEKGKQML